MTQTEILEKPNKTEVTEKVAKTPETLTSTEQELPLARALGAKVCASVRELWGLYPDRRHGSTFPIGQCIVEIEGIATRDYGKHHLEETIVRSRVYNSGNKSEFGPSETLSVHIKTDKGEELIAVDAAGDADVRYRDHSSGYEGWLPMSFQRAESVVDELSHRAIIAAVRHGARTPEDKAVANAHARALLHERFPWVAKSEASLE